jgi:hypothetical protein
MLNAIRPTCEIRGFRMSGKMQVAVLYFALTVTIRCDWMRRTKPMGIHFNVTACRTVYIRAVI